MYLHRNARPRARMPKIKLLACEDGAFVYALTPDQRAQWIMAAQAVHPAIQQDIGGDSEAIYARVLDAKADFKERSDQAAAGGIKKILADYVHPI